MSEYKANADQLRNFMPHRYPFLLIDRILEVNFAGTPGDLTPETHQGTKAVCLKNVTSNEPYMVGHFPNFSIVPGVLILEALAQTACTTFYPHYVNDPKIFETGFQCILVGIEGARFRKPVIPGDTMILETVLTKARGPLWVFSGEVKVDGQKVAEAEILANLGVGRSKS